MRPKRIPSKDKRRELDERSHIGEDEDYILPPDVFQEARRLRNQSKWSMGEIAAQLGVTQSNLDHDFHLRRREIEGMDE
jgi:hypothetical protein